MNLLQYLDDHLAVLRSELLEPTLCECDQSHPDAIGECQGCHRPNRAYLHPAVLARLVR